MKFPEMWTDTISERLANALGQSPHIYDTLSIGILEALIEIRALKEPPKPRGFELCTACLAVDEILPGEGHITHYMNCRNPNIIVVVEKLDDK